MGHSLSMPTPAFPSLPSVNPYLFSTASVLWALPPFTKASSQCGDKEKEAWKVCGRSGRPAPARSLQVAASICSEGLLRGKSPRSHQRTNNPSRLFWVTWDQGLHTRLECRTKFLTFVYHHSNDVYLSGVAWESGSTGPKHLEPEAIAASQPSIAEATLKSFRNQTWDQHPQTVFECDLESASLSDVCSLSILPKSSWFKTCPLS